MDKFEPLLNELNKLIEGNKISGEASEKIMAILLYETCVQEGLLDALSKIAQYNIDGTLEEHIKKFIEAIKDE